MENTPANTDRHWWEQYRIYLRTTTWRVKRTLVLKRARFRCEECGQSKAREVHHLQYPRDCLPGSAAWVKAEKLSHLVALCRQCHTRLHVHKLLAPRPAGLLVYSIPEVKLTPKDLFGLSWADEDLVELSAKDLSTLADEYTRGDTLVFMENYAYYKHWFNDEEDAAQLAWDPEDGPYHGPYNCRRCSESIKDDFPPLTWYPNAAAPTAEVIRQQYACWIHIHDLGNHFCGGCV